MVIDNTTESGNFGDLAQGVRRIRAYIGALSAGFLTFGWFGFSFLSDGGSGIG